MFALKARSRLRRRPLGRYRYVRLRWRLLFAAIDALGSPGFGAARRLRAWLVRMLTGRPPAPEKRFDDPRTILLVQLDHLGDAVISTVMFPALRRRYPNASIEVLASPWNRELFEAVPEVDRVHVCRVNRFSRRSRLGWILLTFWWGWRLRRRHVDLGIDVRGEFPHAVILWLSGAGRRLGWASGGGGFLLTDSPRFVPDRPEVESRLALLAELGIDLDVAGQPPRPVFRPGEKYGQKSVSNLLPARPGACFAQKAPDTFFGPCVVVHVGAGTAAKKWPVEYWRELVARLVERLGAQVVLVGDGGDRTIARAIMGLRPCPGVTDWTGRLGLVELAAVLEQADLFVGGDSGPAHLAAAVGTPGVVLFSGTNNPRQWQPCGEHVRVLRHPVECSPCHRRRCPWPDHPCMRGLAPGQVFEAVEAMYRRAACGAIEEATGFGEARPAASHSAVKVR